MLATTHRLASIDIFRAVTMMLMIFVNDLWTLSGIPDWLGHVSAGEDGLGLADVVFPAFLFIVGLSIPMAIKARRKKGENNAQIIVHIAKRSFALIIMGLFMVNLENTSSELLPISKRAWQILMVVAIMLIWNDYRDKKAFGRVPEWILQVLGILILVGIAIIYRGGNPDNPGWMKVHWWGILGLIGWAYFFVSLIYLWIGDRILLISVALALLYFFNVNEETLWLGRLPRMLLVVSASNHASVLSGVLASLILTRAVEKERLSLFFAAGLGVSVALIAFGLFTRPEWGINKIGATPSWTAICAGISFLSFILFYLLTDRLGLVDWANVIKPAGRSTLTCYIVPYWFYPIFLATIAAILPAVWFTGYLGIVKSLFFALLVIWITGLLERINIRLKV